MLYDYSFEMYPADDGILGVFLAVYLVLVVIAGIFGIVAYVFRSLGLFTIAKRRGIDNYGLAWVPVADSWIIGSIADDYENKANDRLTRNRHWMLWLQIGGVIMTIVACVLLIVVGVVGESVMHGYARGGFVAMLIIGVFALVFAIGAMIAWYVFYYISLYKIYKSCMPDYSVMFIILSVIFSVTVPFFLFAMRNKNGGIPEDAAHPEMEIEYTIYDAVPHPAETPESESAEE